MKPSTVLAPVALAAMGADPASANVGKGASLAFDFFGEGIAKLFTEIFGKRGLEGAAPLRTRQGPPPGVPQFEYDRCYDEIAGLTITATSPADDAIQFSGVPATCMNLANVLVGDPVEGPYALPCGSDCLKYEGLTPEQFTELADALNANSS